MGLQFIQHQLHTGFKLAIVAGDRTLGQILDGHVWGHAVILHLPIDVEAVDGVTWGHHVLPSI